MVSDNFFTTTTLLLLINLAAKQEQKKILKGCLYPGGIYHIKQLKLDCSISTAPLKVNDSQGFR